MSETEATVPMDDKALFDAATATEAPQVAEAPAQEAKSEQTDAGPAHDEQGRFAPKAEPEAPAVEAKPEQPPAEKPAVQAPAEAKQEPPPGWIPAWRAREIADARVRDLEQKLRQAEKPPEPVDPYLDPEKFRDAGVRQAIEPVTKQLSDTREYYSRMFAETKHGEQTVKDAYGWLIQATNSGDPKAGPVLQRAMNSIDPFGEIVAAFKRDKAISTVGDDPNAWFEAELERRKADPVFAAKHLGQSQQNGATPPQSIVRLPPSLNRQSGAQAPSEGSMSDADLYAHATR